MARPLPGPRLLHRSLQGVVGCILVVGVAVGSVSVAVNAALALLVTALPTLVRRDFSVYLSPWLTLWISGAVALHVVGMVALYELVWWWDHLTHVVSAALVAGVGYVVTVTLDEYSEAVHFPRAFLAVFVLLVTLAAGVFWEVAEFLARDVTRALGQEPILVVYGLEDTMLDLVFDAVGAVVVAAAAGPAITEWVAIPRAWFRSEKR